MQSSNQVSNFDQAGQNPAVSEIKTIPHNLECRLPHAVQDFTDCGAFDELHQGDLPVAVVQEPLLLGFRNFFLFRFSWFSVAFTLQGFPKS